MTKLNAIAILLFAIAMSGASYGSAAATQLPHAEFPTTMHDFGTVMLGQEVIFDFKIRNTGSAPLIIQESQHSLPQIKIRFGPSVPPGGSANVTVELDTNQIAGEVGDTIILLLNDPERPTAELTVTGIIQLPIDIVPQPALFFSVFQGETAERSVTVINNRERPLSISRVEPQGDHFVAAIEQLEAGRRFELRVTVPDDATPGRYRERVTLFTDDPVFSRLDVAVNVLIKRDVYSNREQLNFGEIVLDSIRQRPAVLPLLTETFLVKRRDGDMAITSVETDVPFLMIEQDPPDRSQTFQFEVGLNMDRIVPGEVNGTITIRTDDPEFPELVIPVRGVFN